ncbi:MAG: hypothetical protein WD751_07530 [Anaerolineales bacterium]
MLNRKLHTTNRISAQATGVLFRGFRGQGDFAIMAYLMKLAGGPVCSAADLARSYAEPGHDPHRQVLIVEINGLPACTSRVYWVDQLDAQGSIRRVYHSLTFTLPEWRVALQQALQSFNQGRIRQLASEHAAGPAAYFEADQAVGAGELQ